MAAIITGSSPGVERLVRPPTLAGTWYPGQPDELSTLIAALQGRSKPGAASSGSPPIRAVILPHAGYRFSGETALAGLQSLKGATFKRVIVLGPSHQKSFLGLVLPRATHFRTPLGEIPLDTGAMTPLTNHPLFHQIPGVHDREHSIEIQLPLLQTVLADGFQLLPLLVGQMDAQGFAQAAETLRPLCDDQTLLVISGDFTHYGQYFNYQPFPVDAQTAENLKILDMGAVAKILEQDPPGFLDYRRQSGITACAFGPVMVLLYLIGHQVEPRLVQYRTSGSENGDFSHSVSYVAMTFHAAQPLAAIRPETEGTPQATVADASSL
ncbi:MAG: AmmeMemoRadiSam system protein B [Magnetococcales bacterium]|nr:AmmeMemoRadiSam system protein B [Magnetococcales bacterium]